MNPFTTITGGPSLAPRAAARGAGGRSRSSAIATVNPIAAPPTTSTSTAASATTAKGRRPGTVARALASTTPTQHHALTIPAVSATGHRVHAGPAATTAPSSVSAPNAASTAPTARRGGRIRHHSGRTAAPWTIVETMTTTGTATTQVHDRENTAVANESTTHGTSTATTIAVATAAWRSRARHGGIGRSGGQAQPTIAAVATVRSATSAPSATTKTAHDGV